MEQYISKAALVAEIERRKQVAFGWMETAPNDAIRAEFELCDDILSFINTLEMKKVNLEEEIKEVQRDYKTIEEYEGYPCTMYANGIEWIAKHFFELGLSVSNSTKVTTPDIDDVLKENGVNPDSKEAKIIKESYFMAIEKLAQKGEEV